MASDPQTVLDSIPALLEGRDAQGLVELRDHDDKRVRKAVRKALHTLRSRGVEIPEPGARSWSAGNLVQQLRGEQPALATVDIRAVPGALRFMLSLPEEVSGARLYVGTLSPEDRVLEFGAYQQTDGQRGRLERDWQRRTAERQVPVEWVKARLTWARAQTLAAGVSVPRALDEALPLLGDAPAERPAPFLAERVADQAAFEAGGIDDLLVAASVQQWPPMVDLDPVLQRAAEIHGDQPQPTDDDARTELMRRSLEGQEGIREGLSGVLANAFEDTAVGLWVEGDAATARQALDVATELRTSEAAEALPWVPRLLGFQVASLLRVVQAQGGLPGGAAPKA
ncbi:MAG: hypothetical protein KDK70_33120 [Myxococcales bacterium]|nr:hypothetical protein [Myxococcales bacterium]